MLAGADELAALKRAQQLITKQFDALFVAAEWPEFGPPYTNGFQGGLNWCRSRTSSLFVGITVVFRADYRRAGDLYRRHERLGLPGSSKVLPFYGVPERNRAPDGQQISSGAV